MLRPQKSQKSRVPGLSRYRRRAVRICGVPWPLAVIFGVIALLLVYLYNRHLNYWSGAAQKPKPPSLVTPIKRSSLEVQTPAQSETPRESQRSQFTCSPEERERQVAGFKSIGHDVWYWGCPKEIWWALVHQWSPKAEGKVFLDVGMNKGYTAGTWFGLWNPDLDLNVKTLYGAIRKVPPNDRQDCGACADCYDHAQPLVTAQNTELIHVHGVDATEVAITKNKRLVSEYFPRAQGKWTSVHAACSDQIGTAKFAKAAILSEVTSVHHGAEMVDVPMVTVPKIMSDLGADQVFVLKIDTEGNDPRVMLGAESLIANHQITIVFFEYHKLGLWQNEFSLKWFTNEFFAPKGYTCYFLGHMCVMRLTGCWDDVFEYRDWSNVMCVSERLASPLITIMDDYSYWNNTQCQKKDPNEQNNKHLL